jgi:hypothetical protein
MAGTRWAKVDVQLARNPKVRRLRDSGDLALYVCSILYCAEQMTDGVVERAVLDGLASDARCARRRVLDRAARLCTADLWRPIEVGWYVTGFVEYNRQSTRAYVEAARASWRQRQAEHRAASQRDELNGHGVTERDVTGTRREVYVNTPSTLLAKVPPVVEQLSWSPFREDGP